MRAPAVAVALLAAGCSFQGPSTEGTAFACAPVIGACPVGYTCDDGTCVQGVVDAAPAGEPDAAPTGEPDAGPLDPPDAPPPTESQTAIFGDNSIATVEGTLFDAFIDQSAQGTNFGGSTSVSVDADPVRYALMRIDVSTIPPGSVVESAEIVITLFDPQEDGLIEAQVLLVPWNERTATFVLADTGTPWPTPGAGGGSLAPAVVAAADGRATAEIGIALDTRVVQSWVDDPRTNYGLRWRSTSTTSRGCQWHSREDNVAARRPYLRVTYH